MLLPDGPFSARDAKVRKELRADLRHVHDRADVTAVFVAREQKEDCACGRLNAHKIKTAWAGAACWYGAEFAG